MAHLTNSSRRRFLNQLGTLASLAPLTASLDLLNLGSVAAAAETPSDYKALVCVFLFGGNDSFNTIIPSDGSGYATYALARRDLAIPQEQLLPLTSTGYSDPLGRSFGLNPAMSALHSVFETERKLAVILNVGPLVAPITKAQFRANSVLRPPNLESHDDQQFQVQTAGIFSKDNGFTGWQGRLADLLATANSGYSSFANISASGYNVLQSGISTLPFVVDGGNFDVTFSKYANGDLQNRLRNGVRGLLNTSPHMFAQTYANTKNRAIDGNTALAQALANAPVPAGFPAGGLGGQLQTIARIMSVAPQLGIRRQTFFCGIGGFDTHANQNQSHGELLRGISEALAAFYRYTQTAGLGNQVTTYTSSDFGRTFQMNGSLGTDHAWGGIQFVLGGAVQGGFYGLMPDQTLAGPDDMSTQGRFIPTLAVDQTASTLALWFGVYPGDLALITPRIGHFATADLGFLG